MGWGPEHFRALRSPSHPASPSRAASALRHSLFEALTMANITLFGSRCKRNFGVQRTSKQILQSDRYRLLLASSLALLPRSEEPTGRGHIGGRGLWRTTSPWCFDKGYPAARIAGLQHRLKPWRHGVRGKSTAETCANQPLLPDPCYPKETKKNKKTLSIAQARIIINSV